ncbi:WecB/TagA/CpsF family glycosyltransferase [Pseudarthrobacter sp. CCNWLW207]|uniref:WecB/TagA/CpsF family glycosyltransferase n=1 Tax=Pseudarthrobacter sp. CCNWLW207 TaxID=3127468 RepID=UPI0030785599
MTSINFDVDETEGYRLNGMPIFTDSMDRLVEEVAALSDVSEPALIVTPNVDQILILQESELFSEAFSHASLRIVDGMPLKILARLLGQKNVHRNTGADLLPAVCASPLFSGRSIVITGGRDDVLAEAAEKLSRDNPHAKIVGIPFPLLDGVDDPRSLDTIEALTSAEPDVVFLCLGAPKQETWFMHWRYSLPPAVYIGTGAAVDFAAGSVRRAPQWMQNSGLEWLFRLSDDPSRLAKRYLVRGPRVLPIFVRSLLPRRR